MVGTIAPPAASGGGCGDRGLEAKDTPPGLPVSPGAILLRRQWGRDGAGATHPTFGVTKRVHLGFQLQLFCDAAGSNVLRNRVW